MIAILLSLLLAQEAPVSVPRDPSFLSLVDKFKACVRIKTRQYERAKESVSETTTASMLACEGERASIILYLNEKKSASGSELWSLERAEQFVADLIEKPLRTEVMTGLFEIRSRNASASN